MDLGTVKPEVEKYVGKVAKHIRVDSAMIYGSLAGGNRDANDVDLLVLSEDFTAMDIDDRAKLLYRLSVGFPYDLHVYGLAPREYDNASPLTTLGQIKKSPQIKIRP